MYHFAIIALLGLAALKVADLAEEMAPALARQRTLLRLALGVTAAVAVDYSLFDGFGVGVRDDWVGTVLTGLVIGSLASAWRAAFTWLGSSEQPEAEVTGRQRPRVAA